MAYGKVISLFLVDGDPDSRWICDLSNWTGVGFRIPRSMVSGSRELDRISTPGVYFLIGKTEDESQTAVYIGEAEDVYYRITQHINNGEKEWQEWNECVAFCSKDSTLNKAKIKFLENSLYNIAVRTGRCKVMNGNTPTRSSLSAKDEAETGEYLEMLRIVMGSMGYRFLQPYKAAPSPRKERCAYTEDGELFYCKYPKMGVDAKAMIVPEGILVLKGSKIRGGETNSFKKDCYYVLKQKLIDGGIISDNQFTRDYLFSSYTAAASVVSGNNTNGRTAWVDEEGKTVAERFDKTDQ